MKPLKAIRNWGAVAGLAVFWWLPEVVTFPFDRKRRVPPKSMYHWCRTTADALGIRRELRGAEHLASVGQCVLVANHQSLLDILVIGSFVRRDYRWLAKAPLFKVPVLGWHLAMAGHVPVYRGKERDRNKELPARIRAAVEEGASLLFFPEGTRTRDAHLQPFRLGAFVAAVDESLPVVPLVVRGTGRLMPKGAKDLEIDELRSCSVTVLPPVYPPPASSPTDGEPHERAERLRDTVFRAFQAELSETGRDPVDRVAAERKADRKADREADKARREAGKARREASKADRKQKKHEKEHVPT